MKLRGAVLGTAVLALVVAGAVPVAVMVGRSLVADGHLGLAAYRGLLASGRQWVLLGHSLALAALTTLLATTLGVPAGLLVGRTDLPGRRVLGVLLALPLALPPWVTAVAWMGVTAPTGPVAGLLGPGAAAGLSRLLFGLPGAVWVLGTAFMPVVMLLVAAVVRSVPPRLEEAGLLVARWPLVLGRITLPLAAPGILLGSALVFLLALGEVTVPPSLRYPVFAVESLTRFAAFYDLAAATAAAVPLVGLTAVVLALEALLARRAAGPGGLDVRGTGPPATVPLGRARRAVALAAWSGAALVVGVPLGALVARAGGPSAYGEALALAGDALARGLALAGAGGVLLAVEGVLLAVLVRERPRWPGAAVDATAFFLFAVPGAVLGVGLIVTFNHPLANVVYATPLVLLLGYLGHYTAVSLRLCRASLELVPEGLVEAARVAGVGWGRRLVWILAPAARRGIAAAALAGAVFCLRDVGLTLLVHPPGWDTLPVRIMTLAANGAPSLIAALCVILVGVTLVPAVLLGVVLGRREAAG